MLASLPACGGGNGTSAADGGTGPSSCEPTTLECSYPETGYGASIGDTVPPLALPRCDGACAGYPHAGLCGASNLVPTDSVRLSVITVAAGWCVPCRAESALLSERISDVYREDGVEVIQILTQQDDYTPVNSAYCNTWTDAYDLARDNFTQLMDPESLSQSLWPGGTLPVTYIVGADGVIIYKVTGADDELTGLQTQIDSALCEGFDIRCSG